MKPQLRERFLPALLGLSLAAFALLLGCQKIKSPDYWWHLRAGAYIVETGSVPKVDPFSVAGEGRRWIDIHWLHQVALHEIRELGGDGGVVRVQAVVVALVALLVASVARGPRRFVVGVLASGLMLGTAASRFTPRPELSSFLFLAAVLWLLDRHARRGDYGVLAIVPLQLLWANVHGLFAVGLAVCWMALLTRGLERWLRGSREPSRPLVLLAWTTALASAASFLNPNGIEGALYPLRQLGMIWLSERRDPFGATIAELAPLVGPGRYALQPGQWVFVASLGGASLLALVANRRRTPLFDWVVWLAFALLAVSAVRNLALFAIVAGVLLARNGGDWLAHRAPPATVLRGAQLAAILLLVLLCIDTARGRLYVRLGAYREMGPGVAELAFPVGAAEWIARWKPPAPVFHYLRDGGYLSWRLHPDYKPLIDGRLEIYGSEIYSRLNPASPKQFAALDGDYRFGALLIPYPVKGAHRLLMWLSRQPDWKLVYVDDTSALFVRSVWLTRRGLSPLDVDRPNLFPPLRGSPYADRKRAQARMIFFRSLGRERRAEYWRERLLSPGRVRPQRR